MRPQSTTANFPPGFDHALDARVDALARPIGYEMQVKPNVARWEYIALIWRKGSELHRTTIEKGLETTAPLDKVWPQVGWAQGGKIVAIIHSHPVEQQVGSVGRPVWIPLPNAHLPSSADFDSLIRYSGMRPEYDASRSFASEYRSYIVTRGIIAKYFAFDQPSGFYKVGGQAVWAVRASNF